MAADELTQFEVQDNKLSKSSLKRSFEISSENNQRAGDVECFQSPCKRTKIEIFQKDLSGTSTPHFPPTASILGSTATIPSENNFQFDNLMNKSDTEEGKEEHGSNGIEMEEEDFDDSLSELSGLLDNDPKSQSAIATMLWIEKRMGSGDNPRSILQHLMDDAEIPDDLDDATLWKFIASLVADPPKRKRLEKVSTFEDVITLIDRSTKIIVLTGAGVSVSCGIPDFRSRNGIYARLSVDYPDLPDPQAMFDITYFKKNPKPFFKFAKEIYPGQFKPSLSHLFIGALERSGKLLRNYTQNIDTLEPSAGITKIIQCHGSFSTASCMVCKHKVDAEVIRQDVMDQVVPKCPNCSPESDLSILKPDIVFFGESLSEEFHRQFEMDKEECDLLIVMGSSLKVRPVAIIPNVLPSHVPQILINRESLSHMNFDVELLGDCDLIVQQLCKRLDGPFRQLHQHSHLNSEASNILTTTFPDTSETVNDTSTCAATNVETSPAPTNLKDPHTHLGEGDNIHRTHDHIDGDIVDSIKINGNGIKCEEGDVDHSKCKRSEQNKTSDVKTCAPVTHPFEASSKTECDEEKMNKVNLPPSTSEHVVLASSLSIASSTLSSFSYSSSFPLSAEPTSSSSALPSTNHTDLKINNIEDMCHDVKTKTSEMVDSEVTSADRPITKDPLVSTNAVTSGDNMNNNNVASNSKNEGATDDDETAGDDGDDQPSNAKKLIDLDKILNGNEYACLSARKYVFPGAEIYEKNFKSPSWDDEDDNDDDSDDDDDDDDDDDNEEWNDKIAKTCCNGDEHIGDCKMETRQDSRKIINECNIVASQSSPPTSRLSSSSSSSSPSTQTSSDVQLDHSTVQPASLAPSHLPSPRDEDDGGDEFATAALPIVTCRRSPMQSQAAPDGVDNIESNKIFKHSELM